MHYFNPISISFGYVNYSLPWAPQQNKKIGSGKSTTNHTFLIFLTYKNYHGYKHNFFN